MPWPPPRPEREGEGIISVRDHVKYAMRSRHAHLRTRAVTPIIATILLLAITIVAAAVLYSAVNFTPPPSATQVYYRVQGGLTEPVYGDGSDCTTTNGVQTCDTLAAAEILVQSTQPTSGIQVNSLTFRFTCNGTIYLEAPLAAMEWVPGSNVIPGPNAPQLGHCGTYTPPNAAFNRLAYFVQLTPGDPILSAGDDIVFFLHGFMCGSGSVLGGSFEPNPHPGGGGSPPCGDDDYHGGPTWCYTVPSSDCTISLISPTNTVLSINIYSWG